jgi:glucose/arabinose dehydrogenase
MNHARRFAPLGLTGLAAATCTFSAAGDIPVYAVRLQSGLNKPVFVTAAPGDNNRLFLLEQGNGTGAGTARVRVLDLTTNSFLPNPFITVSGLTGGGPTSEQGLLGLAFDPDYQNNGRFYLNYTATGGTSGGGLTRIVRYTTTNFTTASTATAQLVMQIDQPQGNHNGGWMGFGKDNYLYIASGDGGGSNDTGTGHTANKGNAQDLTKPLGKMLRIDVTGTPDPGKAYAIPKGGVGQPPKNPFHNDPANPTALPEIWAYGLRNPWRNSFDRKTGDLYIGDVGQGAREEVNFQPAAGTGAANYGWRILEGNVNGPGINDPGRPATNTLVAPIFTYDHSTNGGNAVTGGYVYRGTENPALDGTYFFADYGNAKIWMTKYPGTGTASARLIQHPQLTGTNRLMLRTNDGSEINTVSSFGEDNQGRLYITELGSGTNGELFRLVPALPGDTDGDFVVDHDDFMTLYNNFAPGVAGKRWAQGDFNDDGFVNFTDFLILEAAFGKSIPFGSLPLEAAVPEPLGGAGGLLLCTFLTTRRHRRRQTIPVVRSGVSPRAHLDPFGGA